MFSSASSARKSGKLPIADQANLQRFVAAITNPTNLDFQDGV
jgi:hypothetical protein